MLENEKSQNTLWTLWCKVQVIHFGSSPAEISSFLYFAIENFSILMVFLSISNAVFVRAVAVRDTVGPRGASVGLAVLGELLGVLW